MPYRVTELHSIIPIANIPSVMSHGILSHDRMKSLKHADVSLAAVQDRRERKSVPNGLRLHAYANLYFCARNPMMYKIKEKKEHLCVLQVDLQVLHLPEVVLTTGNAASDYSRFLRSPNGLQEIAFDDVFADYWTDETPFEQMRKKSAKCAEALVPHCVAAYYITGAYVSDEIGRNFLQATGFQLPITINTSLFFC